MGTYEIINYNVNHPELGVLNKQKVVYYNLRDEIETEEFYFGYIRSGYILK
jgi:hypothetical protein